MRALALFLTLAGGVYSQEIVRMRMSLQLPLPNCDAIVVGDLVGGTVSDPGRNISVSAVLRVQRVVKGDLKPGSEVGVAWSYRPNPIEGPPVMTKVPTVHALWLLSATDKPGEFWPVQLSRSNARYYYLLFPEGDLPAEFSYSALDSTESRLARELGFAMETEARKYGSRLNVTRARDRMGAFVIQGNMEQLQFSRAADLFRRIPPKDTVFVLRRFGSSSLANLRIVGLDGLIRLGDIDALSELERDFDALAQASEATWIPSALFEMPADLTPNIVQTVGRLALSERELPNMELTMAGLLGDSRLAEALPYLAAMLESPVEGDRLAAARGFCAALRPMGSLRGPLDAFWTPEMTSQCPTDLGRLQGGAVVQFWREWWRLRRGDSAILSKLPPVTPPARYRN